MLGFAPGAERRLVEWDSLVRYLHVLDAASNRVAVRELGRTTNGAPFIVAFISSPTNLARLPALGDIQRRLADPRLVHDSAEAARLIARGRSFALITSSIHSTEVGGFFSPLEIAYRLASGATPEILRVLENTVIMLVPSMNPDGVNIVSRWYNQTLGSAAEGTSPPEVYHHYSGLENILEWYALTHVETRLVVDSLYGVWHPQVTMTSTRWGATGPGSSCRRIWTPSSPTSTRCWSRASTRSGSRSRGG
ncbi:MAG: M14 family zinc carboxypeptidase [Gemmatimonadota bacterium]